MNNEELLKEFALKVISLYNKLSTSNKHIQEIEIEKLRAQILESNQFLSISTLNTASIEFSNGAEKVFGIKDELFNDSSFIKIIDPIQLPIAFEYAVIVIGLFTENDISIDNFFKYNIEFNVILGKEKSKRKRITRDMRLIRFKKGKPSKYFSIWTDISHKPNNSNYVLISFYHNFEQDLEKIYKKFKEKWFERLGIDFPVNHLIILKNLKEGKTVTDISENIHFYKNSKKSLNRNAKLSKNAINTYIRNMYSKINILIEDAEFFDNEDKKRGGLYTGLFSLIKNEKPINSYLQLINFAQKYGLTIAMDKFN